MQRTLGEDEDRLDTSEEDATRYAFRRFILYDNICGVRSDITKC